MNGKKVEKLSAKTNANAVCLAAPKVDGGKTVGSFLTHFGGEDWAEEDPSKNILLAWPPDAFAVAGSLLMDSGAYLFVAESSDWPPLRMNRMKWAETATKVGNAWRAWVEFQLHSPEGKSKSQCPKFPAEVLKCWNIIEKNRNAAIDSLNSDSGAWVALVQLVAFADEACSGCGIPAMRKETDGQYRQKGLLELTIQEMLVRQFSANQAATLCRSLPASLVSVLPKTHTPLSGVTMRSMSHNLALVRGCAVRPHWLEQNLGIFPGRNQVAVADAMNVLVVPWPFEVNCRNFAPIHDEKVSKLPPDHRFFGFMPPTGGIELVSRISKLLDMARTRYGRVDGIILPELAIRQDDFDLLRDAVIDDVGFVICGIAQSATEEGHGANYATICIGAGDGYSEIKQYKHHRWYLEDSQIRRYGLSSVLDPGKFWWESATLRNRELTFLALEPWLTMSVLICEDLARPDPVGEIVRAVGPNLVVALLLDGPQIAGRWSERSAAVLADDPGCSVLTLTCLGMSVLSRSPDGKPPMRVIGLWKDREGLQKIELPEGNEAVLLSLSSRYGEEWTADGRGDDKHSANIRLTGIYAIPSPK